MVHTQYVRCRYMTPSNHIDFITTGEKRCSTKRKLTTCISVRDIYVLFYSYFFILSLEVPGIRSV